LISISTPFEEVKNIVKDDQSSLNVKNKSFSEGIFLKKWEELIIFIKQKGKSNLGIALGAYKPRLLRDSIIEILLSNSAQHEMILEDKHIILDYLRNELENDKLDFITKVLESEENATPYTNKDKFQKMLDENPQLEILRVKLGLDPDY